MNILKNLLKDNSMLKKIFITLAFFLITYANLKTQSKVIVKPGIDVLRDSSFSILTGKKIALLTNISGKASNGELTLDILLRSDKFKLTVIFTPEHGFYANVKAGMKVENSRINDIPVISLYGNNRRPTKTQLDSCDAIVVDLQDVGIRSYTFISTLYKTMDAAEEYKKEIIILDRPNPIGGLIVDGNTLDSGMQSFVGIIPVSYIHGCTIGELARMINGEGWLPKRNAENVKCRLTIVKMQSWKRYMNWEDTGLSWTPTSPNILTPDAVRGAAMFGVLGELGMLYLGINTDCAFTCLGASKKTIESLRTELGSLSFPGIVLEPIDEGCCKGLKLTFHNDSNFKPYSSGFLIALKLKKLNPSLFNYKNIKPDSKLMFEKVTGSKKIFEAFSVNFDEMETIKLIDKNLYEFIDIRKKYLLYD